MNLAIQGFMMPGSSCASWMSTGGVPDQFPAGLRVLVVDDDPTCLMILEKMLKICNYEATICKRAEIGLSLLREKKNGYDIVLSDVHMPDMDGFKLLEHIGLEMDLPVIMMSADDSNSVVMKGVTHGACDYLIKPVRIEALRNIWQHVVRRRKHEWKDFEPLTSADEQKVPEDLNHSSSPNEGRNWKNTKRRKDDEDEAEERDEPSSSKKARVVWSVDLHQQFVAAVHQLGIDKAVPKKILELMNVPGLTRENVASHLQKYRLYLRRLNESQHLGYGSMSSHNGLELQALAAASQLPGQSLATLHAAVLGSTNNLKSPISAPFTNQGNIFSFQNPKLLHGIPTNMEPKQFVGLHSFNSANSQVLIPMGGQRQSQPNSNHRVPRQFVGLGTEVSGSGFGPSYNIINDLNPIRTLSDQNIASSSCTKMGPAVTFSVDKKRAAESLLQFPEQYNEDDLTAILDQPQQEGFGRAENEFGFDGYALDDL